MNTSAHSHLSSARNILELIFSEFFDSPDFASSDPDQTRQLLELLLYRALDHIAEADKTVNPRAA